MSGTSATGEARHANPDAGTMIRRWFDEVWNQGKEEAIDQMLAKNAKMWGINRPDVSSTGSQEFKKFYHTMRTTFSDINITLDQVVQEGDTAFARWTVTGTHSGEGPGSPATRNQLTFKGMSACQVQDGMIVEGWNVWDQIGMARQLGVLSGHAATLFP
jgi:steroid delta-isomerase-like uncharacterized protein